MFILIVLYGMAPAESPACLSLARCLALWPELRHRLRILLADNSPEPHEMLAGLPAHMLHDGRNAGLASRYNEALRRAEEAGIGWLLLLDDDTTLTEDYFQHLLAALEGGVADEIVALVPRLLSREGTTLSPHLPAFRDSSFSVDTAGPLPGLVRVFNSGAVLRVSALQGIGGFDRRFPLDSLDHALFHTLQERGGRILLLDCALRHELSVTQPTADPRREQQRLRAELFFLHEFGSAEERRRRRNFLLREAHHAAGDGQCRRALRLLFAAIEQLLNRNRPPATELTR